MIRASGFPHVPGKAVPEPRPVLPPVGLITGKGAIEHNPAATEFRTARISAAQDRARPVSLIR